MAEEECDQLKDAIVGGPQSWFYFNQPINQIQGYDPEKPQILTHAPKFGLTWVTPECINVTECITYEGGDSEEKTIAMKVHKILVIKDFGQQDDACEDIPLKSIPFVQCIKLEKIIDDEEEDGYQLRIERKNMLCFGDEVNSSAECEHITLSIEEAVKCVKYNEPESKIDFIREKMVVFKSLPIGEEESTDCDSIELEAVPVVTCIKLDEERSEISIERTNALVLKNLPIPIEQETNCPNIPLTSCPDETGSD
jgi:hypothetical protein